MAVVTAKFTRSKADARAEIHYYIHRPERDGSRGNRDIFNTDGNLTKEQAYQLIREAERGTKFFKIVISPDPNGEDTKRDLNLANVTIQTMLQLQERIQEHVRFMAVQHDNTEVRHVHVLALVRSFVNEEILQACINAATNTALFQREERDLARGAQPIRQQGRQPSRQIIAIAYRQSRQPDRTATMQAKPPPTGKSCPSCGHTQPTNAGRGKHTCHCTACSYQLHRNHSLKLEKEGGLGLE